MLIVGLVQSSVVLIHNGATAHTLDWYEDDDLEGVRFNYKTQEDLAQDGQPIQYAPFTSSKWHAPSDISSLSSAVLPPGDSQFGVALSPAYFASLQEPIVTRSQSVSSSSTVADNNNLNGGLGVTFGEFPSFKRKFKGQNSISKYASKYETKDDKNAIHSIHKSVTSSSPTMSVSIVRRVGSYELPPITLFPIPNFGIISKSISISNTEGINNNPVPVTSLFSSRKFEVKPVDVKVDYDDHSNEKNALSIEQEPVSKEKIISTPPKATFVPTLALLRPVTAPRPVTNLRHQLRQKLSSTNDFTSSVVSSTQAPILPTYKPVFKVNQSVEEVKPISVEEVKPISIQVKSSDDDKENSKESKESKERASAASITRSKQSSNESKFSGITLKRQSKPLSRFRYQHVLALSREDDK